MEEWSLLENFPKLIKLQARYEEADWTPPLYNIWNFKKNTNTATHFGNSAQEIAVDLLYMYTEPFDGGRSITASANSGAWFMTSSA